MAGEDAVAAQEPGQAAGAEQPGRRGGIIGNLVQMLFVYYLVTAISSKIFGTHQGNSQINSTSNSNDSLPGASSDIFSQIAESSSSKYPMIDNVYIGPKFRHYKPGTISRKLIPYMHTNDVLYVQMRIYENNSKCTSINSTFDNNDDCFFDYPIFSSAEAMPETKEIKKEINIFSDFQDGLETQTNDNIVLENGGRNADRKKIDPFSNPVFFSTEEPYRTVTKPINLTHCYEVNCTLIAEITVWYECTHPVARSIDAESDEEDEEDENDNNNEDSTEHAAIKKKRKTKSLNNQKKESKRHNVTIKWPLISFIEVEEEETVNLFENIRGSGNTSNISGSKKRTTRKHIKSKENILDRQINGFIKGFKSIFGFDGKSKLNKKSNKDEKLSYSGVSDEKNNEINSAPVDGVVNGKESLLINEDEKKSEEKNDGKKTSFVMRFQPIITISPVVDFSFFENGNIPDHIIDLISPVSVNKKLLEKESPSSSGKVYSEMHSSSNINRRETDYYAPIIYLNQFWVLDNTLIQLNETNTGALRLSNGTDNKDNFTSIFSQIPTELNLTLAIHNIGINKFLFFSGFDQGMNMHESIGTMSNRERDEIKRMFLETNPYLLILTFTVSILHMIFEYLAFKNDVSFWKNRKDFKGISLRTVAMNCYFQTIIFLYLLDSEKTSWMILLPCGIGVLIEFWKLRKVVWIERMDKPEGDVKEIKENEKSNNKKDKKGSKGAIGLGEVQTENDQGVVVHKLPLWKRYRLRFNRSYENNKTSSYDKQAIRYLMYFFIPCLFAYAVYSVMYEEHKGWYSFLIKIQVQFIYFTGFAMMTPQIFINYKLRSVAHMPWRTFVYRFLNTIIDDLFAFIITMPTLHRIACFRDDIVFFILLYQRWIYPVDIKRTEEGVEIDDEELIENKENVKENDGANEENNNTKIDNVEGNKNQIENLEKKEKTE